MTPTLRRKLEALAERREELERLLAEPDVVADNTRFRDLSREFAQLEPIAIALADEARAKADLAAAEGMRADPDLRELADEEIAAAQARLQELEQELALLLVMRNPQVSTWYALLLLIYPAFETLFSVYRRMFVRGKSPAMPDGIHLHSLIFRRVVQWAVGRKEARALIRRNSLTSPYLWLFSLMAVIPATVFWRHTWVLMLSCILFIGSYIWIYVRIVRFKAPRWMIRHKKH